MTDFKRISASSDDFAFITDIFDDYLSINNRREFLPDIIHQGIEMLIKIPKAKSASLFILNNDFDFEHRSTLPFIEKNNNIALYDHLVESAEIGKAISTGEIMYHQPDGKFHLDSEVLICPLRSSKNIIGVIIICFFEEIDIYDKPYINLFKLWLGLFAGHIENSQLSKIIEKNQALLEQKLAARTMSIAQSKRELQAILNAVQTAILVIDPDTNTIISANSVAVSLIADKVENIVGNPPSTYFKNKNEEFLIDDKVKFSRNFESTITNAKEVPIPILRSIANINIGNQGFRIESFLDITERKMNEIALKQANELLELKVQERTEDLQILVHKLRGEIAEREKVELEVRKMLAKEKELNEMKSKFVSLVSHEFRTPLTIIRSAAQILDKYHHQIDPAQFKEYLERIISTVDIMTDLMENVLFIGKSDNKKHTFYPRQVNIVTFAQGITRDIKLTSKSEIDIIANISTSIEVYNIDDTLVRQILFNLLTNAIKYSIDNSFVELNVYDDEEYIYFSVKDYGIGIPEEEQERIFDLFYRGSNVGTISGTGLGMTVVLRSLNLHKGKIEMQSKPGEGTIFTVSIPLNIEA